MWQKWELNEKMSDRRKSRPRRVQPIKVWKEAVDRLLDTRGPIYIPEEYGYDPEVFMKKVAQIIARKLADLNGGIGPSKEVDPCEATGVEEHSSENSVMDSVLGFNTLTTRECIVCNSFCNARNFHFYNFAMVLQCLCDGFAIV